MEDAAFAANRLRTFRDEAAPSQWIELHSVPRGQAGLQDIELGGISQRHIPIRLWPPRWSQASGSSTARLLRLLRSWL